MELIRHVAWPLGFERHFSLDNNVITRKHTIARAAKAERFFFHCGRRAVAKCSQTANDNGIVVVEVYTGEIRYVIGQLIVMDVEQTMLSGFKGRLVRVLILSPAGRGIFSQVGIAPEPALPGLGVELDVTRSEEHT